MDWLRPKDEGGLVKKAKTSKEIGLASILDNIDYRLRVLEDGASTVFLLPKAKAAQSPLVRVMFEGKQIYHDAKPARGQAHSMGHEKTSISGQFLQWIAAEPNYPPKSDDVDTIQLLTDINTELRVRGSLDLQAMQKTVRDLLAIYAQPEKLQREVVKFTIRETKKGDQILIDYQFHPTGILAAYSPLFKAYILAAGGQLQGIAPRGPLYRPEVLKGFK